MITQIIAGIISFFIVALILHLFNKHKRSILYHVLRIDPPKLDEELVTKAKVFAEEAHDGQTYGRFPYTKHLEDVANVLRRYGYGDDTELMVAAYLHDIVEDTDITVHEIEDIFGNKIGDIVYAVTNEPGVNRTERHRKTYPKIKANKKAIILKLADRIANATECYKTGSPMISMYRREYREFKRSLMSLTEHRDMWRELERLMRKQ